MVDYIEKINDIAYGGNQFNGERVESHQNLVTAAFKMAADARKVISLADFLPDDGYDYYVTLEGYCSTGTKSGNTADMQIYSGSSTSTLFYRRLCRCVTRASSAQMNGGSIEIPILRSDRNITIYNGDANGTSGDMIIRISSYRRMGNNDSLSNKVEKIKIDRGISSNSYTFGGKNVDGDLKILHATVFSGVAIASNGSKSSSVASIIPEDGYEYEALVSITTGSASTTNKQINIWCNNDHRVVTYYTRSAANWLGGGNVWIRIPTNRQIVVTNPGTVATASTSMRLVYARRIGTNNDTGTYHSYECIPSKTLQPNTLIYGSPTISNGVISGFSNTNYVEIPYGRVDGEYVVKFTMPTSTMTKAQPILHSEYWLCLLVDANSYNIYCYNRGSNTNVSLFNATAGQTYWVKLQKSGTSIYCYYSTDGEQYTACGNFTDSSVNSSLNYQTLLGFGSSMALGNYFLGSIDLNGCYIKVNGEKVWEGMTNSKILPIGGNGFDGEWNAKYLTVVSGVTYGVNTSTNYTLVDYLPDDNNIYEVLVSGYARTGTKSGNAVGLWVHGNAQPNSQTVVSYINTRYSSNYADAKSGTILCKGGKATTITVSNSGSGTSGNCGVQISGYRRIGTNGG